MIVGIPFDVMPAQVTQSNVELETEWVAGTYSLGDVRRVGDLVYEVVADPSTTDEPTAGAVADPPTWLNIGVANRYRAFDGILGRGISRTGTIQMTIEVPDVINTIYLSGLRGNSVRMEVLDGATVLQDETLLLVDNAGIDNIWSFIYEPIEVATDRLLQDLPSVFGASIRITVDAGAGQAQIGEAVLTRARKYGVTQPNIGLGILDFSEKEADEFGGYAITERGFADLMDIDVVLGSQSEADALLRVLRQRRAKPTLYIGSKNRAPTIIYGFYRSMSPVLATQDITMLNIEFRSLTDA